MTNGLDLTLILSAAGTFAAIFIPLIILLLRRQTGPQLDIVLDKEVFLVNQLARDLKNFSISIDGEPATEQVAWITGWIINSGTLDISARMVESPLRLELLETMSWIRVDIDHSSSGVDCKCAVIDGRMAEFDWALLRSGEYVYFDSLIECPLAETREKWAGSSFAEMIQPNSRIENIRTDAIVPISHLGEKYNPLIPRKRYLVPKILGSLVMATIISLVWMRVFFPFDLDSFFGDGFLSARTEIVREVAGDVLAVGVSIDSSNNVKLELHDDSTGVEYVEVFEADRHADILELPGIKAGKISARDRSEETAGIALVSFITYLFATIFFFMWFRVTFLFNRKKRRTAFALYALRSRD